MHVLSMLTAPPSTDAVKDRHDAKSWCREGDSHLGGGRMDKWDGMVSTDTVRSTDVPSMCMLRCLFPLSFRLSSVERAFGLLLILTRAPCLVFFYSHGKEQNS